MHAGTHVNPAMKCGHQNVLMASGHLNLKRDLCIRMNFQTSAIDENLTAFSPLNLQA